MIPRGHAHFLILLTEFYHDQLVTFNKSNANPPYIKKKKQNSTEQNRLIDTKRGTNGSFFQAGSTYSGPSPSGAYFRLLIRSFFPSETPFRTTLRTNSAANCRNKWQRGPQRGPDQQQIKRKTAGGDHAQDQYPFRAGLDPYPAGVYNRIAEIPHEGIPAFTMWRRIHSMTTVLFCSRMPVTAATKMSFHKAENRITR